MIFEIKKDKIVIETRRNNLRPQSGLKCMINSIYPRLYNIEINIEDYIYDLNHSVISISSMFRLW